MSGDKRRAPRPKRRQREDYSPTVENGNRRPIEPTVQNTNRPHTGEQTVRNTRRTPPGMKAPIGQSGKVSQPIEPAKPKSRFNVLKVLGEGGMGKVYLAEDEVLQRPVAVKESKRTDYSSLDKFLEEAQVQAGLNHPGIPKVFDFNPKTKRNYMEFIEGADLSKILKKESLSQKDVLRHMLKVCDTMDYMHAEGWVHRDLKPENIVIGEFGEAFVMDLGLAARIGNVPNEFAGTPTYMAPEQAKNPEGIDERSDVYALGGILYKMVTGQEIRDVPAAILGMQKIIARGNVTAPRKINPDIAPELESIVMKSLAKNPSDRYQSAGELKEDLQAYLEGREVSAHEYTWWEKKKRKLKDNIGTVAAAAAGTVAAVTVAAVMYGFAESASRANAQAEAADARAEVALVQAGAEEERREAAEYRLLLEEQAREEAERSLDLESQLREREEELKRKFRYAVVGRQLIDARDYDAALEIYNTAVEEFASEGEFYVQRAECHHAKRDFEESIEDCQQALELDEDNHAAYRRMGITYAAMGRQVDADEALQDAIEHGSIEAKFDRAQFYHLLAARQNNAQLAREAIDLYNQYAEEPSARYRDQQMARARAELERVIGD